MDKLTYLVDLFTGYYSHVMFLFNYCPSNSFSSLLCYPFWVAVTALVVLIGFIVLFPILLRAIKEQIAWNRHQKKMATRGTLADPDTMEKYKWKALDGDAAELSQEELAQKIRSKVKTGVV